MIFRQYTFYKKHKMIKIAIKSEKNHKNMANAWVTLQQTEQMMFTDFQNTFNAVSLFF